MIFIINVIYQKTSPLVQYNPLLLLFELPHPWQCSLPAVAIGMPSTRPLDHTLGEKYNNRTEIWILSQKQRINLYVLFSKAYLALSGLHESFNRKNKTFCFRLCSLTRSLCTWPQMSDIVVKIRVGPYIVTSAPLEIEERVNAKTTYCGPSWIREGTYLLSNNHWRSILKLKVKDTRKMTHIIVATVYMPAQWPNNLCMIVDTMIEQLFDQF